tara:strand:+ start:1541 stop:1990 length:450 start_codon:yes stop_codon:yes gene_type:complete
MSEIDHTTTRSSNHHPANGRSPIIQSSLDGLNNQEFQKMNQILEDHYDETNKQTILDKPLGEVMNDTVNFFSNSINSYSDKYREANLGRKLYSTNNTMADQVQTHLLAMSLFIRDDKNIIYLGILMILLSVIISFFNISRSNGLVAKRN